MRSFLIEAPLAVLVAYLMVCGCGDDNGTGPPEDSNQQSVYLDSLLVGTWTGGSRMYVVDDWPQVTDTLDLIIFRDSGTFLTLDEDSSFTATYDMFDIKGPVVFGEGTWNTKEGRLILTYPTRVDTFDYQAAGSELSLIRHYPDGNEFYQGNHWLLSSFTFAYIPVLMNRLDTLLVDTWTGGRMFAVDNWPLVTDTLESFIPIDGWTILVFGADSSFSANAGGFYTPGPLEFGDGSWITARNQLILTYPAMSDTFNYRVNDSILTLIKLYPDGNEYYQGYHWQLSPFDH